jgi:1,4-alpha-glucan branching enzyme
VVPVQEGRARLTVHAPDVISVEVAGDFTDWQPLTLTRAGASRWEVTLPIRSGVHRINVRLGQGPWLVPSGATPVTDDFGGASGQFVIP